MNNLSVKEFNEKYRISKDLQDKFNFVPDDKKQSSSSIAGKPKKLVAEIFKRFFSNPIVLISTAAFIILLLCSILIPAKGIRLFEPNKRIHSSSFIGFLPPMYNPIKTISVGSDSFEVEFYDNLNNSTYRDYYKFFLDTVTNENPFGQPRWNMTFNAYALVEADILYAKMNGALNEGKTITPELMESLRASIPKFNTLLGTNEYGADVWTTTWYATWRAIRIALIVSITKTIIGVAVGAFLGFHAGKLVDTISMRIIDIFLAPPTLIWLLMFVTVMGPTDTALITALILVGWTQPVYSTRMFIIMVKDEEYIIAAQSIGASVSRRVFVHALPAVLGKIATNFVRAIPATIMSVASLAFLGFFKEQNDINLGQLLIESSGQASTNFWILLLPSMILLILSLSLQFVALGLHDALDPKVMAKGGRK